MRLARAPGAVLLTAALVFASAKGALADPAGQHVDVPPDESFEAFVPGAARLEGRLLAPCCWDSSRQTLDIHGSPISNELRREIRRRLRAGEAPDSVEADLVRRYTTKILAVPPGSPLPQMGTLLSLTLAGAGALALSMVARWRRRSRDAAGTPAPATASGAPDEWDARLDAELEDRD